MSGFLSILLMFQLVSDFSGKWQLNKDKSNFGGFPAPEVALRSIEQRDRKLTLHTVQTMNGKSTVTESVYLVNGPETKNFIDGRNAYSQTTCNGSTLEILTHLQAPNGDPIVIDDLWEISKDKQTLTTKTKITIPAGQTEMTLVWVKEK